MKRIRDFAQVKGSAITADIAAEALAALHVDEIGLDDLDNQILKAIIYKFNGGPVGIDTISAAVSEERATSSLTIRKATLFLATCATRM